MRFILPVLILLIAGPAMAADPIPADKEIRFKILRDGGDFGTHNLKFSQNGDGNTIVDIAINMSAGLGPFTFFEYEHKNQEVWDGDQILSLNSKTNDNGEAYFVKADWLEDAVKVNYQDGRYEAPADTTYSTSYWHPVMLKAGQLVNSQKGRLEEISVEAKGTETVNIKGQRRTAYKYVIQANVPITIWYDQKTGQWIGLDFEIRGNRLTYQRLNPIED